MLTSSIILAIKGCDTFESSRYLVDALNVIFSATVSKCLAQ